MILFYTNNIDGNIAHLDVEQARHCVQVLRKKEGDAISFVDGEGGFYEGLIQETGKKKCVIQILKTHHAYQKRPFNLHIAIAPTKNINRLEWFLEKATEIGIDEITPIICHHSERRKVRTDRLQKILIAAMKQSLKAYLPQLNEPLPFKQFIQIPRTNYSKYIAQGAENIPLKDNYRAPNNVLVVIGPEGDFSKQELGMAFANNFQGVNLGNSRLRTETAGMVACHTLNLLNE
ncbi:MAG: 16S rRNA (uracil(1498)-N(3))-methyltransferase [Saprospiraceae bacterium]